MKGEKSGFLVVSRKDGEKITLELPSGEKLEVLVIGRHHGTTRIGVQADRSIKIYRSELLEGTHAKKEESESSRGQGTLLS